jgi:hypothetical protein
MTGLLAAAGDQQESWHSAEEVGGWAMFSSVGPPLGLLKTTFPSLRRRLPSDRFFGRVRSL